MIVNIGCTGCGATFSVDPGDGAETIKTNCPACGAEVDLNIEDHLAAQEKEAELAALLAAETKAKDKPVECTVAGVPLEPDTEKESGAPEAASPAPDTEKESPPPVKGEGAKTKCPGCGMEF